ncbi:MAG: hypothetical protein HY907_12410 [Deltaproteobacteria bacterium]|nr:hypothetical protein [Deltaproteobacteria bacterium]
MISKPIEQFRRQFRAQRFRVLPVLLGAFVAWFGGLARYLLVHPRFHGACGPPSTSILVEKLHAASIEYVATFGRCPTTADLAAANLIRLRQATDAWGSVLRIRCARAGIEVRSPGADGQFDTADDYAYPGGHAGRRRDEDATTRTSCR